MRPIELVSAAETELPPEIAATWAARYFTPFLDGDPRGLIRNAPVQCLGLLVDQHFVPVVVSQGDPSAAGACSLPSHYVSYPLTELQTLPAAAHRWMARGLIRLLRTIMLVGGIGRCVYLNNYLLSTNPGFPLSKPQLDRVTPILLDRFPGMPLVIRSVNEWIQPGLARMLRGSGFDPVRSRRVYVFDPKSVRPPYPRNLQIDLKALANWRGEVRGSSRSGLGQLDRVSRYYDDLYLGKHSKLNLAFSPDFFRHLLERELLEFRFFERDGELLAYSAWIREPKQSLIAAFVGYDFSVSQEKGLYRLAFAVMFKEALEKATPLNASAGAGHFKRLRGGRAVVEYDCVFSGHLPRRQQLAWRLVRSILAAAESATGTLLERRRTLARRG